MYVDLMLDSLAGLSVGDALGAEFPVMRRTAADLRAGDLPPGQWNWTDDTEMACTVVGELLEHEGIDSDRIARRFAARFDPNRDYGFTARTILNRIRSGESWGPVAGGVHDGQGSCGNGAAMRVAPLGACYAGDPVEAAAEAARSAQVTHRHPEGIAGAVAVAVAAAHAAHARLTGVQPTPSEFLGSVAEHLAAGETSRLVHHARSLLGASVAEAADELGNGSRVTAQDTVPFTMWVAATHLGDYPGAITACLTADGDIDTTSAITGGIVAAYTGVRTGNGVPGPWLDRREPLPGWLPGARRSRQPGRPRDSRLRRWVAGHGRR